MTIRGARGMGQFAPLSWRYYLDDAIDLAGPMAELLYVRGLAFCSASNTDGFLTDGQVRRAVGVGLDDVETLANRLVDSQLWERIEAPKGYRIRSWVKFNRTAEEIVDLRDREAARKRRDYATSPNGRRHASGRTPSGDANASGRRGESLRSEKNGDDDDSDGDAELSNGDGIFSAPTTLHSTTHALHYTVRSDPKGPIRSDCADETRPPDLAELREKISGSAKRVRRGTRRSVDGS